MEWVLMMILSQNFPFRIDSFRSVKIKKKIDKSEILFVFDLLIHKNYRNNHSLLDELGKTDQEKKADSFGKLR